MSSHETGGLCPGCPCPRRPGLAELGLQVQTDRYCIYWVWLLFSVCFIPGTFHSQSRKTQNWVLGLRGRGQDGKGCPRPVSRDGGAGESFGNKEGVPGGLEGDLGGGVAM